MTVFAAPSTVWAANWIAICRGTPCFTLPSAKASMIVYTCERQVLRALQSSKWISYLTNAGPQPVTAPIELIIFSGTCCARPSDPSNKCTFSKSVWVTYVPGENMVQPSPTCIGVFGIVRIIFNTFIKLNSYERLDEECFRFILNPPYLFQLVECATG